MCEFIAGAAGVAGIILVMIVMDYCWRRRWDR